MVEDTDKDSEETPPEEDEEKGEEEKGDQSEETETPVTAEDAYKLAQNLQKGYTMTRQDIATVRENYEKIQEALTNIQEKKDETGLGEGEEEPLTVKKFLNLQAQQRETAGKETEKLNQRIERDLADLKAQGTVKDEKEADDLLKYAVKHKVTNLFTAANQWQELKEARQEGRKEGAKGKVKEEAGGKVGTSGKNKAGEGEKGFDYEEIHGKDMDELAEE